MMTLQMKHWREVHNSRLREVTASASVSDADIQLCTFLGFPVVYVDVISVSEIVNLWLQHGGILRVSEPCNCGENIRHIVDENPHMWVAFSVVQGHYVQTRDLTTAHTAHTAIQYECTLAEVMHDLSCHLRKNWEWVIE
jgi:hypothetical protein